MADLIARVQRLKREGRIPEGVADDLVSALTSAGRVVAAVDLSSDLSPALNVVADWEISDDLRAALGQPCRITDTLETFMERTYPKVAHDG